MTAVTGVTGKQKQAPPRFRRRSRHSRPLDLGATPSGTRLRRAGGPPPKEFSRLKRRPGTEIFTEFADVKSRISWYAIAVSGVTK